MRVNIRRLPIPGGTIKKGSGVDDFAFIILEAGRVCLENKLKLTLKNLEFILTSLVLFGVWDLGSFRDPGGHLVYLGAEPKDIIANGYHLQNRGSSGIIALNDKDLQGVLSTAGDNSLGVGLGQGVGDTRRQIHANQEAVCGFRRVGGKMGPEGLPILLILFEGGCYISILGNHFISWRGFKGRANAEGSRAGQGEYRGRFKGKGEG